MALPLWSPRSRIVVLVHASLPYTLQLRSFDRAVACLRAFEKKDTRLKARAAVNLSFIYYLEVSCSSATVRHV